ncbi:MAG: hypothetical protein JWO67_6953 [Streptosporangiaceae bacterium]|nr:hypothetical protein [Streptosporangiaceae bacterium]
MSAPALATLEDIPGSDGFTPEQSVAATAALNRASVAVRAYCRRPQGFIKTQTTSRIRARGGRLRIPQLPVISVDEVKILVYGEPTAVTGWLWDGLDVVDIGSLGLIINLPEAVYEAARYAPAVADVTYTAGYDDVPDDVVTVVAGLAQRAVNTPGGGVVQQQTAGPFSYSLSPWARGGPLSLSDDDKAILNRFRRSASTVEYRS